MLSIQHFYLYYSIDAKSVLQIVKKAVSVSNPQLRMAVISFLGVLYLYMGPQLNLFFENEKPSFVQQLNAECTKVCLDIDIEY